MLDDDGQPVYKPESETARSELIERLCALPPIMSALDALLEHFGHDNVAEVTGRTKRLVTAGAGRQKLESRSARTSQAEAAAFMAGRPRVLIFSDAGGPGRRYSESIGTVTQVRRVHRLLARGWGGIGRAH